MLVERGFEERMQLLNGGPDKGGRRMRISRWAITLLVLIAPTVADAQHKVPTIGFLSIGRAIAPEILARALQDFGYVVGKNIAVEYRFGEGSHEKMVPLARELVDRKVDVFLAGGDEAIAAAQEATKTIPIVMFACDALGVGFIQSLARPGGNTTGITCITSEFASKRIGIIRQIVPSLRKLAVLYNPVNKSKPLDLQFTLNAATAVGIEVTPFPTSEPEEIERAFVHLDSDPHDAIAVLDESWMLLHAKRIAELTLARKLPDMRSFREAVAAGGLVSYGPSARDMLISAAHFIPKILAGTFPADLPVEQPTRFELVINKTRARLLGIDLADTLVSIADDVVE
jgi:putative tryptophan/tyrosine transport system substrate-binding protein